MFGLDVSERQMRKVLGQKLRKVSIDEAGSITQDMKRLCYQMIMPALTDLAPHSWLTLLGTAENIPNTFFQSVTDGTETGRKWKVYKWTAHDNPFLKEKWAAEIEEILAANPNAKEASWFRTHYLNEWCSDDDLLIIKMNNALNFIDELPPGDYMYALGVDLGYNDASAFSVIAFSHNLPHCYVIMSFKETMLDITGVAERIKTLQTRYPFYKIVIDGSNKQGVEEMRKRHMLSLEPAEKKGKAMYLRLLRDDLIVGHFKMINGENNELFTEWSGLQWKDSDKEKEDDRCQNYLSDATLYAWRESRHYTFQPPEEKLDVDTDAYMNDLEKRECETMRIKEEEDGDTDWFDGKIAA